MPDEKGQRTVRVVVPEPINAHGRFWTGPANRQAKEDVRAWQWGERATDERWWEIGKGTRLASNIVLGGPLGPGQ
jgi:hypothetical protein